MSSSNPLSPQQQEFWLPIWQATGYPPPRFWFGNQVLCYGMAGKVTGLNWAEVSSFPPEDAANLPEAGGWRYQIELENPPRHLSGRIMSVLEPSVELAPVQNSV